MNKVVLIGRLTRDPDVRYTTGENSMAMARYTLAVYRRRAKGADQTADFISCVAFGGGAEFADKYLRQGMKIAVVGHIQTGSYTNNEGRKIYTTDVVVEEQEFAESKKSQDAADNAYMNTTENSAASAPASNTRKEDDGFMNIPEGDEYEGLPFI